MLTSRVKALATGAALLAAVAAAGGCGHGGEKAARAGTAPKPVPVTVAAVERRTVERTVEVVGTLKGWEDVTVGTRKEGRVRKVLHDMGDRVKPGELLVQMETEDADLAVRQAERQLQAELAKLGLTEIPKADFDVTTVPSVVQARAALEKARQIFARERSLMQRSAGTMQDFQNAESDEKAAEAALANVTLTARSTLANALAARVRLDIAAHDRKEMEIRAPVPSLPPEGVTEPVVYAVTKRSVAEGQILKSGDKVMDLVIEKPIRLWASVPERSSAEVAVGQPVRLRVSSFADTTFEGKVARINPSVDPVSRTFQVEAVIANNRGLLRPGGFAEASILTDRNAEATAVPVVSVVKFAGVTKVFLVEGDKARSVNVETGVEGPGWVEVTTRLPRDARVVTEGLTQLADGTPVVVKPAKADVKP